MNEAKQQANSYKAYITTFGIAGILGLFYLVGYAYQKSYLTTFTLGHEADLLMPDIHELLAKGFTLIVPSFFYFLIIFTFLFLIALLWGFNFYMIYKSLKLLKFDSLMKILISKSFDEPSDDLNYYYRKYIPLARKTAVFIIFIFISGLALSLYTKSIANEAHEDAKNAINHANRIFAKQSSSNNIGNIISINDDKVIHNTGIIIANQNAIAVYSKRGVTVYLLKSSSISKIVTHEGLLHVNDND